MANQFAQVPLSALSVGTVLTTPIFDPNHAGTKLLGENIEINSQFLRQLTERGIETVVISQRDLAVIHAGTPQGNRTKAPDHTYHRSSMESDFSRQIDFEVTSSEWSFDADNTPRAERLGETPRDHYDREAMSNAVQSREQQISYVDELLIDVIGGSFPKAGRLEEVCRHSITAVAADKDLYLCLGLNPYHANYPARHGLHVCSVAIAIGVVLGLDEASLIELGTGCLLHDVGMLKMGRRLYKSNRPLSESELNLLADHPVLTLDTLACPGAEISHLARIVAYQIHERCDGSGYPRGRRGDKIHPLAKIAAVADTYVALVSNRPHRRGMIPYYAMEKVLRGVSAGWFDPVPARALLHAISLFPIGSFVETSHGRIARVVRATGETYTRPMIEMWNEKHQEFENELLSLVDETTIQIVRATRSPRDGT